MIQLPADEAEIAPGHAYRWRLSLPDPEALPSTRRTAGYNQAAHLAATRAAYAAGRPAPFALAIACGFELPGPLDLPALEAAFLQCAGTKSCVPSAGTRRGASPSTSPHLTQPASNGPRPAACPHGPPPAPICNNCCR